MHDPNTRCIVDLQSWLTQSHRVMAFDYGTQKTGVAVGNTMLSTSQPLAIIPMKEGIPNPTALANILQTWQPTLILVGLPLNMDDSENALCLRAAKFARRIHANTGVPVYMLDERLSSREARSQQRNLNNERSFSRNKPTAKDPVDSLAASVLLSQFYLSPVGYKA